MSKTAVIFPGQGTQKLKMGESLLQEVKFQNVVEKFAQKDNNLKSVWFGESQEDLNQTRYAQLAIVAYEIGLYEILKDKISIDGVMGFSLGEFSAYYASGIYDLNAIAQVIDERSKIMQNTDVDGTMYAILGTTKENLEEILKQIKANKPDLNLQIANYNGEKQIVLSGLKADFEVALPLFKEAGIKRAIELSVAGPFHSSYYQEVAQKFSKSIENIERKSSQKELYLNVTGDVCPGVLDLDLVAQHMYKGVQFYPQIKNMIANGYTKFIEVGPGEVLKNLIKKIDKNVEVINIQTKSDLSQLEEKNE